MQLEIVERTILCPKCNNYQTIVNLPTVFHTPICDNCTQKSRGSSKLRKEVHLAIRTAVIDYDPGSHYLNNFVESIIGCTILQFRQYIEGRFRVGMSWNNYPAWRLDKVVPVAYFNVNIPDEFYYCFNFRNFRPMFADEIVRKPFFPPDMYKIYKRNLPATFRARYESTHL